MTSHLLSISLAGKLFGGGHRRLATGAVALTAALATGGAGATAEAATTESAASPAAHCVVDVDSNTERCFDTFRAALNHATAGEVANAPRTAAAAAADTRLMAQLNQASAATVIGIVYDLTGFRGSSRIYNGNGNCTDTTDDVDYSLAYVGSTWNDDIGSFRAYGNCAMTLYEHMNFGGAALGWYTEAASLGSLDEEASSIRWS